MSWKAAAILCCVLMLAGVFVAEARAAAVEPPTTGTAATVQDWNETDSHGVYTHSLIDRVLEEAANEENIEERGRTFVFGKNGVVTHETVDDHRHSGHSKMELLLRMYQDRQDFLRQMRAMSGNSSALLDPNDSREVAYQKLKEELMEETNGTMYDPDLTDDDSDSNDDIIDEMTTMMTTTDIDDTSSPSYLDRGKRYNWGGWWAWWPKAIVPYKFLKGDWKGVKMAMDRYEDLTCVRFVPYVDAENTNNRLGLGHPGFVNMDDNNGCWSHVGNMRKADGQWMSCCDDIKCVHEWGHTLGMMHEQNNYLRDGWMRPNLQNVESGMEGIYVRGAEGAHFTLGYDPTSIMHYKMDSYTNHKGPTMTMLFPELSIADEDFYMFKEVNYVQKCSETDACAGFTTECENDGYVSVLMGKCSCRCPLGLDPATGCQTTLTKMPQDTKMPRGQYALLKPKTGCPDSEFTFQEGTVVHYGEGSNYYGSDVLEGEITKEKAEHHFCVHDDDKFDGTVEGFFGPKSTWPIGKYCILRKGDKCPADLRPGHVKYGDRPPMDGTENSQEGEVPDGVYDEDTRFEFCCQYNGNTDDPIVMPTSKPFILFPVDYKQCQEVQGMVYKKELFGFDSMDDKDVEVEGLVGHFITEATNYLGLEYCYYTKADMDCGGVITLSAENPETVIDIVSPGQTDRECTWLVKGENEKGSVVLNFGEFDVNCDEKIEIRHSRVGQKGLLYCGEDDKQSVKSILDKLLIRFKAQGPASSRATATVRWIPNTDMCYSVEDKGVLYSGTVNYTKLLEPCLPWSEVTSCLHSPWTVGDELDNLEENYCRNPDNSFGPWCYTDLNGCKRNYCDVCRKEQLFDRGDDCEEKKSAGFCTKDQAAAVHSCGKTCGDKLPGTGPVKKYSEIQCDPPTAPVDGVLVGDEKSKYSFGEEAKFKCKHGGRSMTKACMSNGDWTPLGFVCIECPIGAVIKDDSCYLFIDKDMNYVQAKAECNKHGGEAAMPNSPEENEFISKQGQGKDVWIGISDRESEGTWVFEDGTATEWRNFDGSEPNNWNNEEHCASIGEDLTWSDRVCDYDSWWAKMPVVCEVPRVDVIACADFLEEKRCVELLTEKPTMCFDYTDFAKEYCAKTCGVCKDDDASPTCLVEPPTEFVKVLSDKIVISVGEDIKYVCKEGFVKVKGDEHRACLPNGKFTGDFLVCQDPNKLLTFVKTGAASLSKGAYSLPDLVVFSGENAQWTIKEKGEVHAWEYYSNSPSENAFQVWRIFEAGSKYKLIGQTVVKTGNDLEERHELPEGERIPVEPGDIIAIWKSNKGGVGFNRCSPVDHPTWAGTSWSRKISSSSDLKVGDVEDFGTGQGCAVIAFRAVIAV